MGQRRILMSQEELQRYHVLSKAIEGRMSALDAAGILYLSRRQVFRLKAKVMVYGPEGIIHGNRGREPATTKSEKLLEEIRNLYKRIYNGFNISHFTEKLNEIEGISISRETVRKDLRKHNVIGKMRHAPKHRSRRERMPMVGMMLQHDASEHDWLEGRGPDLKLIASIDDANNEVPYALFIEADGTLPNMEVMKEIVKLKGIPMKFCVDGASYNKTHRNGGIHYNLKGEYPETQIQRALNELGINLIIAGSPQAKGRIERLFGTFQDRLISEMRLKKISTKEDANRFLHGEFLPDHKRRFTVSPAKKGSAYRKLPSGINLDSIFCIKEERTVQGDNTISYRGRIFQIIPQNGRMSYTRGKVEVQEWTDRTIHVLYKGKELVIKEIPKRPTRLIEKPKRFKLKDFLRKEVEPQTEFCGVT
ncbi:MAG: ISNCY family transposase [Nitrospirota bacterium]|nr:ISNCY family transposase [Nitrospirota bacterium]